MATLPNPGTKSSGGQSLNLFMAGLAALSLAFFTYAMPDDIFSGLVARSGLPAILAAAEPPLGMKARGAVIAAAAILIFAAVLMLFRAIDRISSRAATPKAEPEAEAPRLRRADAHPDAPARRPLLAGRDLGDYVEPEEDEFGDEARDEERFADLEVRPLPGFLAPAQAEAPVADFVEPAAFEPAGVEPTEDESAFDSLVSQLPEPGEAAGGRSITDLMQRLESGLSRREEAAASAPADHRDAPSEPVPGAVDERQSPLAQASAPELEAEVSDFGETERYESDFRAYRSADPLELHQPAPFEPEVDADEPEAIDFAALRTSDRHISEFGVIEPEAGADEEVAEAEDEPEGIDYAPLRARRPLNLDQPVPQAPALQIEEAVPAAEPQVGHRLRGTINDLRRIAARG